ncbi:hypothetical protein AUJ10_03880 [Candidatus Pacearchaeota archaeon CG1_02_31_27]|nr:MAG: hypothetical protein AUJ10_03880 [Candidatus Pacearchaeota archaeon CG1_02_31_27]
MGKINFKSYFKLLRIVDARGYFLLALFGFFLAKGFLFPLKDILLFWLIVFLLSGFSFSINDCFDQREDRFDKKKRNPIVLKEISFKKALIFSLLLAVFGLIFASFSGKEVFLLCLAGVILIFLYSSPPFRLKGKPPLDLITHGFFGGLLILFFPFLFFKTQLNSFHYLLFLSLFYFSAILELRNEYEDYEVDKRGGLKTTAHILDYKKTERILRYLAIFYSLFLLPIFYSLSQINFLFLFLILTILFFTLFLFFENHKLVKNYKLFDCYNFLAYSLILLANL